MGCVEARRTASEAIGYNASLGALRMVCRSRFRERIARDHRVLPGSRARSRPPACRCTPAERPCRRVERPPAQASSPGENRVCGVLWRSRTSHAKNAPCVLDQVARVAACAFLALSPVCALSTRDRP